MMFQFRHTDGTPSVDEVCRRFGFRPEEIDTEFGVIQTDPEDHLYTILVDETSAARIEPDLDEDDAATGFFGNPPIEPFGPPEE